MSSEGKCCWEKDNSGCLRGYLMSRIAATCYMSGSRLGVVFDDFGSTHGGKKITT